KEPTALVCCIRGLCTAAGKETEPKTIGGHRCTCFHRYRKLTQLLLNRLHFHSDFKFSHLLFHLEDRRRRRLQLAPDSRHYWDLDQPSCRAPKLKRTSHQTHDHVKKTFLLGVLWH